MHSSEHESGTVAMAKVAIAWLGAFAGSVTLSDVVLFATLVFTCLQIYVLARDKLWRRRNPPAAAKEADREP